MAAIDAAQHLAHTGFEQLAAAKSDRLVGQAQRVAHGAARAARQEAQRLWLGRDVFLGQHAREVLEHGLGRHRPQVELQAAREHGHGHLLRIGRGQHELEVFGRFFERLEHRVERGVREHVDFIDHEDLEAPLHRLVDRLLQQALHFVHATVGSGVEFGVVDEAAGVDVAAGLAHATGLGRDATLPIGALAVERLGQDARDRGLAHAPRAGEQVSVVQALLGQRIGQGLAHMLLAHHFGEAARAVLAGQDEVGHGSDSIGRYACAPAWPWA